MTLPCLPSRGLFAHSKVTFERQDARQLYIQRCRADSIILVFVRRLSAMRFKIVSVGLFLTLANAELNLPFTKLDDAVPSGLASLVHSVESQAGAIPSELAGLVQSVESQAKAAASEIESIARSASTAVPSRLLSNVDEFLPSETSTSGAVAKMRARLYLTNGLIGGTVWHLLH